MNYRHAFHAGNFADVAKHVTLLAALEAMTKKDPGLSYVETHAGAGDYDLTGEADRTGEYKDGVLRLFAPDGRVPGALPPVVQRYLAMVRDDNAEARRGTLVKYPGSPLIAARALRPQDRLVLCELAEGPAAELRALFAKDARVAVHRRDGYEALRALLPPTPRRGLVLVDPPFEAQEQEFKAIAHALAAAWTRWPTGTYVVWYPIKLRQHVQPFHRWLRDSRAPKILLAELLLARDDSALRLNGCGLAIVNTPWQLDRVLAPAFAALHERLSPDGAGGSRVEWLVG